MRDDTSDRPSSDGMFGRKTAAATTDMSKTISLERALPPKTYFQSLRDQSGIDESLSCKQSGLAFVFVSGNQTQPVKSGTDSHASKQSRIRNLLANALPICLGQLSRNVAIGSK